jgi:hypothetical protein
MKRLFLLLALSLTLASPAKAFHGNELPIGAPGPDLVGGIMWLKHVVWDGTFTIDLPGGIRVTWKYHRLGVAQRAGGAA